MTEAAEQGSSTRSSSPITVLGAILGLAGFETAVDLRSIWATSRSWVKRANPVREPREVSMTGSMRSQCQ